MGRGQRHSTAKTVDAQPQWAPGVPVSVTLRPQEPSRGVGVWSYTSTTDYWPRSYTFESGERNSSSLTPHIKCKVLRGHLSPTLTGPSETHFTVEQTGEGIRTDEGDEKMVTDDPREGVS